MARSPARSIDKSAAAIRAWQAGHVAAAARARSQAQKEGVDQDGAIAIALSLIATARASGLVRYGDVVRQRGERDVRESWARLRRAARRG